MYQLFGDLFKLLRGRLSGHTDDQEQRLLELAYAVVLVDLAFVDDDFTIVEHEFIKTRLQGLFSLELDETYDLIREAQDIIRNNDTIAIYTECLKEKLSAEEKEKLIRMLDQMIRFEGKEHGFEQTLRDRYEHMLGVRVDPHGF